MPRGRPIGSEIRQKIIDILYYMGSGTGYDIFKIYKTVFPKCTNEVVYYHLKKGCKIGEFVVKEIKKEKGNFSWGPMVEKIYYELGPDAKPRPNPEIEKAVKAKG